MTNIVFLIVTSLATSQTPAWQEVAGALEAKHAQEAKVLRLVAAPAVTDATEGLRELRPTHVAFVMRPEEVDFKTTLALKRMMRAIDDDPYEDAVWGIVTGPTAADAKRMAASVEPRLVRTALTTTGVSDGFAARFRCLSDAYPEGCWKEKGFAGTVAHHAETGDVSRVFAEGWKTLDPDLVLTSSHASQRNLEMPFSRGNIVPRNGRFETCPGRTLIDYRTGRAKDGAAVGGEPLATPQREKVWLAAGNCLIADNLAPGENMVMTALGFGKVNQFVGYIATTWFGEVGWGTLKGFSEGLPLVDAYHEANRKLLEELEETVANAKDFQPVFETAADYDRLLSEARRFRFVPRQAITNMQQFVGRLWDRDATVFYGDPLVKVRLKAE